MMVGGQTNERPDIVIDRGGLISGTSRKYSDQSRSYLDWVRIKHESVESGTLIHLIIILLIYYRCSDFHWFTYILYV